MTEVDQRRLAPNRGDSLDACIATCVGVGVEDVPDTEGGLDLEPLADWLRRRNLGLSWLSGDLRHWVIPDFARSLCVVVGPSPRDKALRHAVVGRIEPNGVRVVHDPHPSRAGIEQPWSGLILFFDWDRFCRQFSKVQRPPA